MSLIDQLRHWIPNQHNNPGVECPLESDVSGHRRVCTSVESKGLHSHTPHIQVQFRMSSLNHPKVRGQELYNKAYFLAISIEKIPGKSHENGLLAE